jgi:NAD(P)-dependent dehydrogenase (short-subunit alcohol dehydrogenase family)
MQLENKICLIAGASGAIGSALAERFYDEGARLALTHRTRRVETGRWQKWDDNRVFECELDICDRADVNAKVRLVREYFGGLDVLVNCTGALGPVGPTSEVSSDDWIHAVETNFLGAFYLTRAVLNVMARGKIIHFSGGGAAYARPFYSAYSSSKAALVRFSESLAEELRDRGIDVNTIAPGPVESGMWDELRSFKPPDEKTIAELKRMDESGGVSPLVAAELAVFLASDRSNGLTGRLISAVWDPWSSFDQRINEIMNSEAGTLRRVPLS